MWIDLYALIAVVIAIAAWLISQRFLSYDPPGDITRGFWSIIAGALWPLVIVGVAQALLIRYVARRLRGAATAELDLSPLLAAQDVSLRS